MDKKQALILINSKQIGVKLDNTNTHWSNLVRYGNDFGWWLNIPFHKFNDDLFIILNEKEVKKLIFIQIPKHNISNPETKFRNKENTADIYISIQDKNRLTDSQSNSTSFQFAKYVVEEYPYS